MMGEQFLNWVNTHQGAIGIACVGLLSAVVGVIGGIPLAGSILGIGDDDVSVQMNFERVQTGGEIPKLMVRKRTPSWDLSVKNGNEAELLMSPGTADRMRVQINRADINVGWHIRLHYKPLVVDGDEWYALRFRARADDFRKMGVAVSQAHGSGQDLGLYRSVEVVREWRDYEWKFLTTSDDRNAQINFDLGGWKVPVEVESVQLLKLSHHTPRTSEPVQSR